MSSSDTVVMPLGQADAPPVFNSNSTCMSINSPISSSHISLTLRPPLPQGEGWGEGGVKEALKTSTQQRQAAIQRNISERNAHFFEAEADKLDGWADDLKVGLEREIKEFDRQIKEARRAATTALTLEEKLAGQKKIRAIEAQRNQKRRSLFDAQDQVDKQRDELITQIEGKLNQQARAEQLFSLRWRLD